MKHTTMTELREQWPEPTVAMAMVCHHDDPCNYCVGGAFALSILTEPTDGDHFPDEFRLAKLMRRYFMEETNQDLPDEGEYLSLAETLIWRNDDHDFTGAWEALKELFDDIKRAKGAHGGQYHG